MGWSFTCNPNFKRAQQVEEFRRPGSWSEGVTLIDDRVVGNRYWACLQLRDGTRFIFLALMKGGGKGMGWGYKSMDEAAHPYYYDCPLALLDLCTDNENENAKTWRAKVREYHAKRKATPKAEAGLVVSYNNHQYKLVKSAGPRRGWCVELVGGSGMLYRMTAKQVAEGLRAIA